MDRGELSIDSIYLRNRFRRYILSMNLASPRPRRRRARAGHETKPEAVLGWNVSDCHMTATRLEFFSFIPRPNFSQVGQSDPRKIWFGNETRNVSVRSLSRQRGTKAAVVRDRDDG